MLLFAFINDVYPILATGNLPSGMYLFSDQPQNETFSSLLGQLIDTLYTMSVLILF